MQSKGTPASGTLGLVGAHLRRAEVGGREPWSDNNNRSDGGDDDRLFFLTSYVLLLALLAS